MVTEKQNQETNIEEIASVALKRAETLHEIENVQVVLNIEYERQK